MKNRIKVYHVYPNTKGGKTVAYLVVNIFGLVVNGIRIISGSLGQCFVAYPSFKTSGGQYKETVAIEDSILNRKVQDEIMRQYEAMIKRASINPFIPVFDDEKPETDKE